LKLLLLNVLFFHFLLGYDYNLVPQKVNATTYCFFGAAEAMDEHNNGYMVNSCYVNMGEHYLVIDSGPTYQFAQQTYAKMKEIQALPISFVINTHTHDDHWLGNSYYQELGINIIGSKEFKHEPIAEMTRMQQRITKEAYEGTTQVLPNDFVDANRTLEIDGKKVYIKSVNKKAHSKSDLFIYIPEYSTVFAGDLVFNERIPSVRDGNIKNWIEVLDEIKSMKAKYVIGGHGNVVNKHSIDATYTYLTELQERVSLAIEDGADITDTLDIVKMKDFKNFKMYEALHRANVETVYRMMEWEE
jgi:glyoxylase-like metal-dependent hydrolase (beta-lactamase superfamily II)